MANKVTKRPSNDNGIFKSWYILGKTPTIMYSLQPSIKATSTNKIAWIRYLITTIPLYSIRLKKRYYYHSNDGKNKCKYDGKNKCKYFLLSSCKACLFQVQQFQHLKH